MNKSYSGAWKIIASNKYGSDFVDLEFIVDTPPKQPLKPGQYFFYFQIVTLTSTENINIKIWSHSIFSTIFIFLILISTKTILNVVTLWFKFYH